MPSRDPNTFATSWSMFVATFLRHGGPKIINLTPDKPIRIFSSPEDEEGRLETEVEMLERGIKMAKSLRAKWNAYRASLKHPDDKKNAASIATQLNGPVLTFIHRDTAWDAQILNQAISELEAETPTKRDVSQTSEALRDLGFTS